MIAPRQPAVGDQRSDTGRRIETGDSAAAGAQPFGERTLRDELDLQLTGQILPFELFVLADVRPGGAADAFGVEQHAESPTVDSAVVRNRLEVARALFEQCRDQIVRHAVEAEAADGDRCAAGDVGNRLSARSDDFVHTSGSSATSEPAGPARHGGRARYENSPRGEFTVLLRPGRLTAIRATV